MFRSTHVGNCSVFSLNRDTGETQCIKMIDPHKDGKHLEADDTCSNQISSDFAQKSFARKDLDPNGYRCV